MNDESTYGSVYCIHKFRQVPTIAFFTDPGQFCRKTEQPPSPQGVPPEVEAWSK